jgi:chromosome segregation ATPase
MNTALESNQGALEDTAESTGQAKDASQVLDEKLSMLDSSFKVLRSQLNLVTSEYGSDTKSIEALSAKQAVLNQQIDLQKQKITTLQAALMRATAEYGEGSAEANKYQAALYDAQATLGKLEGELKDCGTALDKASSGMDGAECEAKELDKAVDGAGDARISRARSTADSRPCWARSARLSARLWPRPVLPPSPSRIRRERLCRL